jgi:hypothetical protein
MPSDVPRQLTDDERRVLDGLLAIDFDGADALRIQATSVAGRRGCECGCGTIELVPQPNAPRSTASSPVPSEGRVFDDEGKEIGGLLPLTVVRRMRGRHHYHPIVGMKASYKRTDEPAQVLNHIAKIAPRTVIFDVEPLVAFWDPTPPPSSTASPNCSNDSVT